jgi:hypothetical protein
VPEQTARDHLKAAEDYEASAPDLQAKVDSGELTPKKARAITEKRKAPEPEKDEGEDARALLSHQFGKWRDWLHRFLEEHPRLRSRAQALLQSFAKEAQEDESDEA